MVKSKLVPAGLCLSVFLLYSQAQAITVETTNFISSPAYFNGFEAMGPTTNFPDHTPYSEGGITVTYVGTFFVSGNGIWSTYTPTIGGQGNFGWYENGTTAGYTDIKLTSGGGMQAIQFLAGSGWKVPALTPTFMQYQVLNQGSVVLTGALQINRNFFGTGTMEYFGFSGGGFDEIRLENQATNPNNTFADFEFDAGAYDSFAVNSTAAATPLPAALPLFAAGLGALGLLGWRRKRKSAVAV